MAAGLVVEDACAEPDRLFDSDIVGQRAFDLLARKAGIAVGIEQAFLGGDQRALAIDMDRAAFEHDGRTIAVGALDLGHLGGDQIVLVPGEVKAPIEPAPGIEDPVDRADRAAVIDDKGRAAVAHP